MQTKKLAEANGLRTFAIILETGDEAMASLQAFAAREGLLAAHISAIGAFREAVISYFDWERKAYDKIPVREQVEVASLSGDVALDPQGKPAIHVHVVLGRRDGSALAGHLTEGHVRPTLEIILTETPAHLHKRVDAESGLALIRIDRPG
ncbi:DNA-binding protein [Ancylobacter sonchi]|uniref:PPC domain-containing DNA-binding protein n=1 Tax=Ancylobacter sonchi TaxID=1937790 RepID=UPI0028B0A296|nr:DNA-binding protein [Ancylobacter sonchi]